MDVMQLILEKFQFFKLSCLNKKFIFVTSFLLKSLKVYLVGSVAETAVPVPVVEVVGTAVEEAVPVPETVVEEAVLVPVPGTVEEEAVLVPGTVVEAVPGTVEEAVPVPGTVEEAVPVPGTVEVDPVPGTVVVAVPGTVEEAVPGTAAVETVEVGHIPVVGAVAVPEQTAGELAVLGPSRASGLHFYQILALGVHIEDYRSLRVAWRECSGKGNLEESDPSPSFSEPPSVSPAQTAGILPQ